jgi:hypothetical protein
MQASEVNYGGKVLRTVLSAIGVEPMSGTSVKMVIPDHEGWDDVRESRNRLSDFVSTLPGVDVVAAADPNRICRRFGGSAFRRVKCLDDLNPSLSTDRFLVLLYPLSVFAVFYMVNAGSVHPMLELPLLMSTLFSLVPFGLSRAAAMKKVVRILDGVCVVFGFGASGVDVLRQGRDGVSVTHFDRKNIVSAICHSSEGFLDCTFEVLDHGRLLVLSIPDTADVRFSIRRATSGSVEFVECQAFGVVAAPEMAVA